MSRLVFMRATLVALATASTGCFDPVVSNEVSALGGEASGVRRGPLHRPGQPCLLCHDGALGDPPAFSVAGTVFNDPVDMGGADNAAILLIDSDGKSPPEMPMTNAAGNFYLTPDEWSPVFPLTKVGVISAEGVAVTMYSESGRSGGCATCHVSPAGPTSPGPVCITLVDGGVPP